jgi:2-furoyl-CoA dehydrogenase large subunit
MPSGSNRGYGSQQHNFSLERVVDLLAATLKIDAAELRFRNVIPAEQLPYTTATGGIYDSGDYPGGLTKALDLAKYAQLRELQSAARAKGRYVGVGVALGIDPSASNLGYITLAYTPEERRKILPKSGSSETVTMALDGGGRIAVTLCTAPHGQGHDTVTSQIVADALGVTPSDVVVANEFDTRRSAWTFASGTYSSRFGAVGVSAVSAAAEKLRGKIARVAAVLLEAAAEDLEFTDGRVSVRGAADRSVTLKQITRQAQWNAAALKRAGIEDPALRVTETFTFTHLASPDEQDRVNAFATYAFIAEVVAVEVFPETGAVEILKYTTVHDAGTIINPLIVEGQIHGSVLHGIGGALYEEMVYDDHGQPLTATFMDYACPTAEQSPPIQIGHLESPSPFTALGSKGMGEGSSEVAPVVIANAVADALAPLGVPVDDLPLTRFKVWEAVRRSQEYGRAGAPPND